MLLPFVAVRRRPTGVAVTRIVRRGGVSSSGGRAFTLVHSRALDKVVASGHPTTDVRSRRPVGAQSGCSSRYLRMSSVFVASSTQ